MTTVKYDTLSFSYYLIGGRSLLDTASLPLAIFTFLSLYLASENKNHTYPHLGLTLTTFSSSFWQFGHPN